jgi:hypothetical protein
MRESAGSGELWRRNQLVYETTRTFFVWADGVDTPVGAGEEPYAEVSKVTGPRSKGNALARAVAGGAAHGEEDGMTKDEKRIAIAEFCGARWYQVIGGRVLSFNTLSPTILKPDTGELLDIPNYPEDLNAMHEAIKQLDDESSLLPPEEGFETQLDSYINELEYEVSKTCAQDDIYKKTVTASAEQSSTAFVKAIGKWRRVQ